MVDHVSSKEEISSVKFHQMAKMKSRDGFVKLAASDPAAIHELVFAVQQSNLAELEDQVLKRSTPGNPQYQQWMSFNEVGDLTANKAGSAAVRKWLIDSNVKITSTTLRGDFIRAEAPISVWNSLLNADFYQYEDKVKPKSAKMGRFMHRATEYSLPSSVRPHLAAVFNTIQTPPVLHPGVYRKDKVKSSFRAELKVNRMPFMEHITFDEDKANSNMKLQANGEVTVAFLNEFYHITTNTGSADHSQSVFQTNQMYYSPNDLTQFQNTYDLPVQAAQAPFGFTTTDCTNNECSEGNLDLQYIMGVAQQTAAIYWYVPPTSNQDPFVDWITAVANESDPPLVNSISWGSIEQSRTADVLTAFNTEAIRLAAMGVTVLVSSGDNGAAGAASMCNTNSGSSQSPWTGTTSWTGAGYFPSFPASSPYVTAVGATQGPETGDAEIACQSNQGGIITTGGGFSTFYATPTWQQDAVDAYFNSLPAGDVPTSGYNRNGRGYPDISLIGVNYQTVIQGQMANLFGTSASAPVFAAMLTLLNAARATNNRTSVGFINPTLYGYGMPNTFGPNGENFNPFNDITSGHNQCTARGNDGSILCCSSGFASAPGWDPVTGWGSVFYPELAQSMQVQVNYTTSGGGSGSKGGLNEVESIVILVVVIVAALVLICAVINCLCCQSRPSPPPAQHAPAQHTHAAHTHGAANRV